MSCARCRKIRRRAALTLLTAIALPFRAIRAIAHDGEHDDWFTSLTVPGSPELSCCNKSDCRPVDARIRADGRWEAYIDEATFPKDPINPFVGGAPNEWMIVPDGAIIAGKDNPIGQPVACFYARTIRCFVPGIQV